MNKYYKLFIEDNELLLNEIYRKAKDSNLFDVIINNKSFFGVVEKKISKNENFKIEISEGKIDVHVHLKNSSACLTWDLYNFSDEIKRKRMIELFRNPTEIMFELSHKNNPNSLENRSFNINSILTRVFLDKEKVSVNMVSNNLSKVMYFYSAVNSPSGYQISFDSNLNIKESGSLENQFEEQYSVLKKLKEIKEYVKNFEEITDQLFLSKKQPFSTETRDALMLFHDLDENGFCLQDDFNVNIGLFTSDYEKLQVKKQNKKNRKKQ